MWGLDEAAGQQLSLVQEKQPDHGGVPGGVILATGETTVMRRGAELQYRDVQLAPKQIGSTVGFWLIVLTRKQPWGEGDEK